jgi:hypothetical protein
MENIPHTDTDVSFSQASLSTSTLSASTGTYTPHLTARILTTILIWCGAILYGKEPSYLKFRSLEIIARVPYQSWTSACFTLLTCFFSNEKKALSLSKASSFAEFAQANETMHVVVISQLAQQESRAGFFRYTFIPMLFSFFYFWFSYVLYLLNPRISYELNYLFEDHAYTQYDRFLHTQEKLLKEKKITSVFLHTYGRDPINQYDFFLSVRDDEKSHRDASRILAENAS